MKKHDHVTVTLRDYERNPDRNSKRDAWMRFAKDVGAVVIDDYKHNPIPLVERWDLYQCQMNYFVDNGPAVLCYYSEAPYMTFGMKMTPHLDAMGFYEGYQFPWANSQQRLIWAEDTYVNLKHFSGGMGSEIRKAGEGSLHAVAG